MRANKDAKEYKEDEREEMILLPPILFFLSALLRVLSGQYWRFVPVN